MKHHPLDASKVLPVLKDMSAWYKTDQEISQLYHALHVLDVNCPREPKDSPAKGKSTVELAMVAIRQKLNEVGNERWKIVMAETRRNRGF